MLYGDEDIIRARVAAQSKKRHTIENEVDVDGVKYAFARRELEYGFSMIVPENFVEMPKEIAKRKFLNEDRPKIIISSNDFRVCIMFNIKELPSDSIESRLKNYRNFMKSLRPTNVFFSAGICQISDGVKIGCYDYRYTVIDNDVYNITFFMDFNDMELLGWFICPFESRNGWEPLARQMISSFEVITPKRNVSNN